MFLEMTWRIYFLKPQVCVVLDLENHNYDYDVAIMGATVFFFFLFC